MFHISWLENYDGVFRLNWSLRAVQQVFVQTYPLNIAQMVIIRDTFIWF